MSLRQMRAFITQIKLHSEQRTLFIDLSLFPTFSSLSWLPSIDFSEIGDFDYHEPIQYGFDEQKQCLSHLILEFWKSLFYFQWQRFLFTMHILQMIINQGRFINFVWIFNFNWLFIHIWFSHTMRRDLLNNVLRIWAGIFLLNI